MADETLLTGQDTTATGAQPTTPNPAPTGGEPTTKPEGQTNDGGQPAGDAKPTDEGKPAAGAPEKYADFTVPEGVTLEATTLEEVTTLAKELNLTQEQAQKLVDRDLKVRADGKAQFDAQVQSIAESRTAELRADKDIGGEQLSANIATANKALKQFFPELIPVLKDAPGVFNDVRLVKGLVRIGKAISEDGTLVRGATPDTKRPERILYDKTA